MSKPGKWAGGQIKIFHLIGTLERGGTEMGMLMTLPRLDRKRFASVVCAITTRTPLKPDFEAAGVRTYSLRVERKWDMRAVRRLVRLLKAERPNIVHTYLFHGNMLGRVAGRLAGIPVIVSSERSVNHHSHIGILLNRMTAGLVTAVETNSEAGKAFVGSTLGIDPGKVYPILPGVEVTDPQSGDGERMRRELGLPQNAPVIAFVGRLHPAKGLSHCIRAFAAVMRVIPEARLLLVGDGPERASLESLAQAEGVRDSVFFLGRRSDVGAVMSAADVVVLPSMREGFPRVVLEAMAMAKPVVASHVGGVPEAVVDGATGLLVPPAEPAKLAEALLKVLSDRDMARRMGLKGRSRFEKYFSLDQAVARYERFYHNLVKAISGE